MKRFWMILLALVLCASCAMAESAATYVLTPLYEAPDMAAQVLMRYRIGVRVEVIRDAGEGFVQVNAGDQGGSLMGYMEKRNLVFGEENIRSFHAERVTYRGAEGQTCTLYSYPDIRAPIIDPEFNITVKEVLGEKNGEWLHVREHEGGTGFVALEELEGEYAHYEAASYIVAEPLENELSRKEALVEAKSFILKNNPDIDAAYLERCIAEMDILYYYETPSMLTYTIQFRDPDTGYIYAGVSFLVEGMQIVKVSFGNG